MWYWVEYWKDGREVVFGPFETMVDAAKAMSSNQFDWAEDVVEHISVEKR